MFEIAPKLLRMPAEKKKVAVSRPVTFIGPVTETPVTLVMVSRLDPAVTPNASVTAEPPTVNLPEIVADVALRAPEIVADAALSAPEIAADATVRAELAALIAPAEIVSPAARVARPDA